MSDVTEASQLIAFGLRPKLLPREDAEYGQLISRYRADTEFADLVDHVACGMRLQVLDVTTTAGAVLGAQADSLFAVRMADYSTRAAQTTDSRVIHGLIQLATAALCFPRPADLDDPDRVARVSAEDIDEYVRELSRRLDAEYAESQLDPPAEEMDLARVWRAYCSRPSTPSTLDGRAHQSSTLQFASKALGWLDGQGCMRRVSDDRGGTYQATDRYRILVRDFAGSDLYAELSARNEKMVATPTEEL